MVTLLYTPKSPRFFTHDYLHPFTHGFTRLITRVHTRVHLRFEPPVGSQHSARFRTRLRMPEYIRPRTRGIPRIVQDPC